MCVDLFGNPIEIGDIILRPMWARMEKKEVVNITPKAIYVKSTKLKRTPTSWEEVDCELRICRERYLPQCNFINLTKMNKV
jgi:hypothetical protein